MYSTSVDRQGAGSSIAQRPPRSAELAPVDSALLARRLDDPIVDTSEEPIVELRPSRAARALDVAIASGMLLVTAPALGASILLVRVLDGRPTLYHGERLGAGARSFTITKIRTLRTDAQARVGGELMSERHRDLKTRSGNFLRETRLDELPQLLQVIRGDMALFGPRPERPEVFASKCRTIPRYSERFLVRPGLFGYAQILTPHGTPKRVRALIDRRFVRSRRSPFFDSALLALTLGALAQEIGARVGRFASSQWNQRLLRRYAEKRGTRRVALRPGHVTVVPPQPELGTIDVVDATERSFRLSGTGAHRLRAGGDAALVIFDRRSGRRRNAHVRLTSLSDRRHGEGRTVVVHYEPRSENSEYMIDQYVLDRSIVRLPRWIRGRSRRALDPGR